MRITIISFLLVVCVYFAFGQAGMNVYAGPSMAFSKDNIVTGSGEAHYGYVIGVNARLNSDPMYFILSGEYGTMDFVSNKSFKFIGGDDLSYVKTKIGLGFDIIKISPKFLIRTKLQGSLMFVNGFNDKLLKLPKYVNNGYTEVNDGIAGVSTCAGITLGILTVDLEYEYGLFNIFQEKKNSKLNFINLVGGVRF
jgi:hypothetical protein